MAFHFYGFSLKALQRNIKYLLRKDVLAAVLRIFGDTSHLAHSLLELLPSERRYRVIRAQTNRFRDSFYPMVQFLNKHIQLYHCESNLLCLFMHALIQCAFIFSNM